MRTGQSGQVLLEALVTLPLVLWLLGFGIDLIRRVENELVLHHIACLAARGRALGTFSNLEDFSHRKVSQFFNGTRDRLPGLTAEEFQQVRGWEVKVFRRYPALFSFPWRGKQKHHFEVSERCLFPIG